MRDWILKAITCDENFIKNAQEHFKVSRQAVYKQLRKLEEKNLIQIKKDGKKLAVSLVMEKHEWTFKLSKDLSEDFLYQKYLYPLIKSLPENVTNIWNYGFTEMVNNAIDHSGGDQLVISFEQSAVHNRLFILDNGEGIFNKIQKAFHLNYPQEAILELSKGKLTTDPNHHSGEGIFFTSRMFDFFAIHSTGLCLSKSSQEQEEFLTTHEASLAGTGIVLELFNDCTRHAKDIFDQYVTDFEDYAFSRTVVPVALAQYEGQSLISRSQAKRLYNRFEKFQNVVLDFKDVAMIGQAFADELFRVFVKRHPEVKLSFINVNLDVTQMIKRALSHES